MLWSLQLPEQLPELILLLPLLLLSLTIHEVAHARTALAFGDDTALRLGRVTLNPLAHLDPMGTIMLLVAGFGWAKPVPVNPHNLRPYRLGEITVSLAGPASNLTLAAVSALGLRLLLWTDYTWTEAGLHPAAEAIAMALLVLTLVNVMLCVFNLLPLYPLDGHHILREILPRPKQDGFMQWQLSYGRMVLLGLLFVPPLINRMNGDMLVPDPLEMMFDRAGSWFLSWMIGV